MLHVELNRNEAENAMQANILPFYTPTFMAKGQNNIFLKLVMLHIKLKEKTCRTLYKFYLMHISDILG